MKHPRKWPLQADWCDERHTSHHGRHANAHDARNTFCHERDSFRIGERWWPLGTRPLPPPFYFPHSFTSLLHPTHIPPHLFFSHPLLFQLPKTFPINTYTPFLPKPHHSNKPLYTNTFASSFLLSTHLSIWRKTNNSEISSSDPKTTTSNASSSNDFNNEVSSPPGILI